MINSIQSDANPPDPNLPIPNCQRNAKDMITMINSIQSDPNLPDPNHPIPNRQENAKDMITMINSIQRILILLTLITLSLTIKKTLRTYNDDKFNPENPNPPDPNHPIPNCQENAKDI